MQKFSKITAVAASLPITNVDTDMIIPKQFLKTVKRTGLGANLFDEMRFTESGEEISDFILNKAEYKNSGILVSLDNFGCGSSREHAPWALLDFGIKCIIAPSYADIFFNNCFKNGILPIVLSKENVDKCIEATKNAEEFTVDLPNQTITLPSGEVIKFDVEEFRKKCLIEGLDDIGLTLEKSDKIAAFEAKNRQEYSWLYNESEAV